LQLVLDSNEYIFALGLSRKKSCETLLKHLINNISSHSICTCRTIIEEVRVNLTIKDFHNFVKFVNIFTNIDEDFLIPFELGAKYESRGLKDADALIAAFSEWTGADALVTENRHFLSRRRGFPFKVLTAEKCLKLI
jgi:predicted nucleic acid-binding protein